VYLSSKGGACGALVTQLVKTLTDHPDLEVRERDILYLILYYA
jgi:hypothetical protein